MSRRLGARPRSRGHAVGAFPYLRLVALIETGTHALCDVVVRPFRCAEQPAGLRLLRSVGPGMLLLWDRAFRSYAMVHQTLTCGAHFLGRTKSNVVLERDDLAVLIERATDVCHEQRQELDAGRSTLKDRQREKEDLEWEARQLAWPRPL
jgi:hypothetical protein